MPMPDAKKWFKNHEKKHGRWVFETPNDRRLFMEALREFGAETLEAAADLMDDVRDESTLRSAAAAIRKEQE